MKRLLSFFVLLFLILNSRFLIPTARAISDPLSVPNNKVGIHLISATTNEASDAAALANSNGDWGYVTVLIESKDRNTSKWQEFFNDLRKRHLIPIVRLATKPIGDYWERPYSGEENAWADFLDNLIWPIKNRYVIIYNETNQAHEWGNTVDPEGYAKVLDNTITALKNKNPDFFVLNAGFDASAPTKMPAYEDEKKFLEKMNQTVPGIFNKLDGWVSHSYPNPNFTGSPDATGRGTVRTYKWELQVLKDLGLSKNLPIFITETGWNHSEGQAFVKTYPSVDKVADYYKTAFQSAWNDSQIVAVTPFILNYQHPPFDHFSFQKIITENSSPEASESDKFYPTYHTLKDLSKTSGAPIQEAKARYESIQVFDTIVYGESYDVSLTLKNIGQTIWNKDDQMRLLVDQGKKLFPVPAITIPQENIIEPGQSFTFVIKLQASELGKQNFSFKLMAGPKEVATNIPLEFQTEIKSPVVLQIKSNLKWKKDFSGEYVLDFVGVVSKTVVGIILDPTGNSEQLTVKSILPTYDYDFTLKKPFYKPKTIHQTVYAGTNTLDFGELEPNITSAILHPNELWKLLPFSKN